jgi:hypothetical protein
MGLGESQYDDLDVALIAVVKRSPQYRMVRERIADACPSDGWCENGLAFVVFDLHPVHRLPSTSEAWQPQVVFVLAANSGVLLAARLVEPGDTGQEMFAHDLLRPEGRWR